MRDDMNDNLVARVAGIAADVFGEEPDSVQPNTTPTDLDSWDSFAQLNLVMALEDEFGIQFAPDDLEAMSSIAAIAALVESRIP
jgi:acyl carrier protein